MLDLSKLEITKQKLPGGKGTVHGGGVRVSAFVTVDDYTEHDLISKPEVIRAQIQRRIWDEIYGELHRPLMELQEFAFLHAREARDNEKVSALCATLKRLLTCPLTTEPVKAGK